MLIFTHILPALIGVPNSTHLNNMYKALVHETKIVLHFIGR